MAPQIFESTVYSMMRIACITQTITINYYCPSAKSNPSIKSTCRGLRRGLMSDNCQSLIGSISSGRLHHFKAKRRSEFLMKSKPPLPIHTPVLLRKHRESKRTMTITPLCVCKSNWTRMKRQASSCEENKIINHPSFSTLINSKIFIVWVTVL